MTEVVANVRSHYEVYERPHPEMDCDPQVLMVYGEAVVVVLYSVMEGAS